LTYTPARILRNCSILHITLLGFKKFMKLRATALAE